MTSPVRSVVQAFAIMRVVSERAMTLSQIAAACGISPSSCLGLLRTLVAEGILLAQPGKYYALTPEWAVARADPAERLIARVRPLLVRSARAWQAPVGLWRAVSRDRLQLVALGESPATTRIHMVEGQRQPIGGGATGRALAAAQDIGTAEITRRFAAVRWERPVELAAYTEQIGAARMHGYASDEGFGHAGIVSLAVALPEHDRADYCLSVSMFAGSRDAEALRHLAAALRSLGHEISSLNEGAWHEHPDRQ